MADPSRYKADPQGGQLALFLAVIRGLTLDDWKWNADKFNKVGEQIKKAGLQRAYHNHNFEWRTYDGLVAYDEFLRRTDPALVKLELDCGWAAVAGKDPAEEKFESVSCDWSWYREGRLRVAVVTLAREL